MFAAVAVLKSAEIMVDCITYSYSKKLTVDYILENKMNALLEGIDLQTYRVAKYIYS